MVSLLPSHQAQSSHQCSVLLELMGTHRYIDYRQRFKKEHLAFVTSMFEELSCHVFTSISVVRLDIQGDSALVCCLHSFTVTFHCYTETHPSLFMCV